MAWNGCQIGSPLGSSEPSGSSAVSIVDAFHPIKAGKEAKMARSFGRLESQLPVSNDLVHRSGNPYRSGGPKS
jgi:hypothetical protein